MRSVSALLLAGLLAGNASAGVVELVSRAAVPGGGQTGGGNSTAPALSADGRYLAFSSSAPNLAPGIVQAHAPGTDIYLFDRVAGDTRLVSVSAASPGKTGNAPADSPAISADGRWIAYGSNATDVVTGVSDANQTTDVFLYDRTTGAVVLVSHSAASPLHAANALSYYPSVSGDGRWVAFSSFATDLVPGSSGSPSFWNVYLWDRTTGLITLVSHASNSLSIPGTANSGIPLISVDGSTVVFSSQAPNLAPAAGSSQQIYAFDRASGLVRLVSHAALSPGTGGSGWSVNPDVSANGRYVAFETTATDIVPGQTGTVVSNVFVWDASTGASALASHSTGSSVAGGGGSSRIARVSADGNWVVYASEAPDLTPGFVDNNAAYADVYLYDRVANVNALVSHRLGSATAGGNGDSPSAVISGDGSKIAFFSRANDLIAGLSDFNVDSDVFVFDRSSGTTVVASHLPGAPLATANGSSGGGPISADGAFVVYQTLATDLFGPSISDLNGLGDLVLFDVGGGTNVLVSQAAPDAPCLSGAGGSAVGGTPRARSISADGRFVVFGSDAGNLVAGQVKGSTGANVFLADRWAGTSALVSHFAGAPSVSWSGGEPALSGDGRWTAFTGPPELAAGVPPGAAQVLLYDRLTGGNVLVSHVPGALAPANGFCSEPAVSADGNWIAFTSVATDLVSGSDGNLSVDVFLYDRIGDVVSLVSHRAGSPTTAANAGSLNPTISADGSIVTFISSATDLTPGETGGVFGAVYTYARASGQVTLISHAAGLPSQRANGIASNAFVSGDGLWVAYQSRASDVAAGQVDSNNVNDVFLWDRLANTSTLVSHAMGQPATAVNSESSSPSLSDDGRFVAFASFATNLVSAAGGAPGNIYLFERASGLVSLVSATPAGHGAAGASTAPVISPDGGRVAFASNATDLVAGFLPPPFFPTMQRFIFTRATGTVQLASGAGSSPTAASNGDDLALIGALSADGNVFAFSSVATNLVPGDFNGTQDVFVFRSEFLGPPSGFSPLPPCRVVDTRGPAGPWGAPSLAASSSRSFVLAGRCGIPAGAVAVSANIIAVNPSADGSLSFAPAGFTDGGTSFLSFRAGQTRANNAVLSLGAAGATAVDVYALGPLDLVIDVNGYFK